MNADTKATLASIESLLVAERANPTRALEAAYRLGEIDGMLRMARIGESVMEQAAQPGKKHEHCTCPGWWNCSVRGCHEDAKTGYAATVDRFEPRADHDQDTAGRPMKAGR